MDNELRYNQIQDELEGLFKDVPPDQMKIINNLIQRVSFMHVTLEDLEKDIRINGPLELTKTRPRKLRERPSVKMYNALIKNYNATIKQMMAWMPALKTDEADDELLKFLKR
jgi:hypothetical protein